MCEAWAEQSRDLKVQRVASWLDVRYPGWADKIDLAKFHISVGTRCVGGYLFPEIAHGWHRLQLEFTEDEGVFPAGVLAGPQYNDCWRAEITARLTSEPVKAPSKEPVLARI
jgi:hypothetical protein